MLHAPVFGRRIPNPRPPLADGIGARTLTSAAYLRLRRKAAGLTVDQVVQHFAPLHRQRADAAVLIRMLETDGTTARSPDTLERLRSCYSFDPDVYRQLATEPASRHPRICLGCGCSQWDPCHADDLGACAWAGPALCTRCPDGEWH